MFIVVWEESTRCAIHNTREEVMATIAELLQCGFHPDEILVFEADEGSRIKIDW